jgi:hypothetical protein
MGGGREGHFIYIWDLTISYWGPKKSISTHNAHPLFGPLPLVVESVNYYSILMTHSKDKLNNIKSFTTYYPLDNLNGGDGAQLTLYIRCDKRIDRPK